MLKPIFISEPTPNPMVQNPSEKQTVPWLAKKFPAFYGTLKVHCSIYSSLPSVPDLFHINPVYIPHPS
jgi:hypothetical protein